MHKPMRSLLTSKSQNPTLKARSIASFDATSPNSAIITPLSKANKLLIKQSYDAGNPLVQDNYDPLPSFGDEVRYGSAESAYPKVNLNRDFQNENVFQSQPETHRSRLSQDFGSRLRSGNGNQTTRASQAVKDLKNSSSYLNAMKALQIKVKELMGLLQLSDQEKMDLEKRYQREVDILAQRYEQERRSLLDLENGLKTRLDLLEEELKERERTIDALNSENERLRNMTQEVETGRALEIQQLLNDKGRLKSERKELEGRFEERERLEDELRGQIIQLECALGEKESFSKELREKISLLEKEKIDMSFQFEQKLGEVVAKQKQAEEKRRELEMEVLEEKRRRSNIESENEKEVNRLKLIIQGMQDKENLSELRVKERETELIEKSAQILTLKEQVNQLAQEQEKVRNANDRTHFYAQDMAKMNQRLLSNMMGRSDGSAHVEDMLSNSRTPRQAFSMHLPQGIDDLLAGDYPVRRHQQSMGFDVPEHLRTDSKSLFKAMGSGEKNREMVMHQRGWSMKSPGKGENIAGEGESFYQGPKLSGEDLMGSGNFGRGRNRSISKSRSAMKERGRTQENADRAQHEMVIKEIIEVERETLEKNREYQKLTNDIIGLDRESEEYKKKKRKMEEIADKLQEKSAELVRLKKREEEILEKMRF